MNVIVKASPATEIAHRYSTEALEHTPEGHPARQHAEDAHFHSLLSHEADELDPHDSEARSHLHAQAINSHIHAREEIRGLGHTVGESIRDQHHNAAVEHASALAAIGHQHNHLSHLAHKASQAAGEATVLATRPTEIGAVGNFHEHAAAATERSESALNRFQGEDYNNNIRSRRLHDFAGSIHLNLARSHELRADSADYIGTPAGLRHREAAVKHRIAAGLHGHAMNHLYDMRNREKSVSKSISEVRKAHPLTESALDASHYALGESRKLDRHENLPEIRHAVQAGMHAEGAMDRPNSEETAQAHLDAMVSHHHSARSHWHEGDTLTAKLHHDARVAHTVAYAHHDSEGRLLSQHALEQSRLAESVTSAANPYGDVGGQSAARRNSARNATSHANDALKHLHTGNQEAARNQHEYASTEHERLGAEHDWLNRDPATPSYMRHYHREAAEAHHLAEMLHRSWWNHIGSQQSKSLTKAISEGPGRNPEGGLHNDPNSIAHVAEAASQEAHQASSNSPYRGRGQGTLRNFVNASTASQHASMALFDHAEGRISQAHLQHDMAAHEHERLARQHEDVDLHHRTLNRVVNDRVASAAKMTHTRAAKLHRDAATLHREAMSHIAEGGHEYVPGVAAAISATREAHQTNSRLQNQTGTSMTNWSQIAHEGSQTALRAHRNHDANNPWLAHEHERIANLHGYAAESRSPGRVQGLHRHAEQLHRQVAQFLRNRSTKSKSLGPVDILSKMLNGEIRKSFGEESSPAHIANAAVASTQRASKLSARGKGNRYGELTHRNSVARLPGLAQLAQEHHGIDPKTAYVLHRVVAAGHGEAAKHHKDHSPRGRYHFPARDEHELAQTLHGDSAASLEGEGHKPNALQVAQIAAAASEQAREATHRPEIEHSFIHGGIQPHRGHAHSAYMFASDAVGLTRGHREAQPPARVEQIMRRHLNAHDLHQRVAYMHDVSGRDFMGEVNPHKHFHEDAARKHRLAAAIHLEAVNGHYTPDKIPSDSEYGQQPMPAAPKVNLQQVKSFAVKKAISDETRHIGEAARHASEIAHAATQSFTNAMPQAMYARYHQAGLPITLTPTDVPYHEQALHDSNMAHTEEGGKKKWVLHRLSSNNHRRAAEYHETHPDDPQHVTAARAHRDAEHLHREVANSLEMDGEKTPSKSIPPSQEKGISDRGHPYRPQDMLPPEPMLLRQPPSREPPKEGWASERIRDSSGKEQQWVQGEHVPNDERVEYGETHEHTQPEGAKVPYQELIGAIQQVITGGHAVSQRQLEWVASQLDKMGPSEIGQVAESLELPKGKNPGQAILELLAQQMPQQGQEQQQQAPPAEEGNTNEAAEPKEENKPNKIEKSGGLLPGSRVRHRVTRRRGTVDSRVDATTPLPRGLLGRDKDEPRVAIHGVNWDDGESTGEYPQDLESIP